MRHGRGRGHFRGRWVRPAGGGFYGSGFYRSRGGMVFGVCQGLSRMFGLPVFWVRVLTVILFFVTGMWPVLLVYIAAACLMKKEPVVAYTAPSDREFYDSYARSRTLALDRLRSTYDRLNRRIQRIESRVTASDFDWDRRLDQS